MKLDYILLVIWNHFCFGVLISQVFLYCKALLMLTAFPSPETDLQLSNQCFFFFNNKFYHVATLAADCPQGDQQL
jgi:hypothetical protein